MKGKVKVGDYVYVHEVSEDFRGLKGTITNVWGSAGTEYASMKPDEGQDVPTRSLDMFGDITFFSYRYKVLREALEPADIKGIEAITKWLS